MLFLIVIWQSTELLNIIWFVDLEEPILLFSVQAGILPTLYLAPAFVRLAYSLFGKWKNVSNFKKFLWWLPSIIMSFFVFTPYNLKDLMVINSRFYYVTGPLYYFFAVYFVSALAYGLYFLAKNRKMSGPIVRRQVAYIFAAVAIAAVAGLIFNIIFPILGMYDLYYLGVNSTIFFTVIMTYALFRYRFFNLKMFGYQIFMNFFKLLVTVFIYYILYLLFHSVVMIDFSIFQNIVFFLMVIGLTAPFVFNIVSRLSLALFLSPNNDIKVAIDRIVDILRSSRDLDVLLSRLSKEIDRVVDFKEMFVYFSKKKDLDVFYQIFPVGERLLNKADSNLIDYLSRKKQIANLAEIDYFFADKGLIEEMKEMRVDVALPIFYNKQLLGILLLDNDGKLLSIQELQFLGELNKYLDIAVGSLLLYQQDLSNK
jgi:hypothetical protein